MYDLKLIVDGAPESLPAAEFAIDLATYFESRLCGVALVNAKEVLDTAGYQGTGLCGSGIFLDAYERILDVSLDVNDALLEALKVRAGGHDVTIESQVFVGEPMTSIKENLSENDVYILGGSEHNICLARTIYEETHRPVAVYITVTGETPKLVLMADDSDELLDLIKVLTSMPIELYWFDLPQCPLYLSVA